MLLCAAIAQACAGELAVDLPSPLLVVDTYPSSGATVEREHLLQLTVTFSEDLGAGAAGREDVVGKIGLERLDPDADPALPGERIELGRSEYHAVSHTLVFTPNEDHLDSRLLPGVELLFTIGAGIAAADGPTLSHDVRVRFWIAQKTRG